MALHASGDASKSKSTVATIKDQLLKAALAGSKMVQGVVQTHNKLSGNYLCARRRQTLSIIALSFSLEEIRKLGLKPQISKDVHIRARSHAKAFGAGADQFENAKKRSVSLKREDVNKALEFMDDPTLMECVAFGTSDLDLGDGRTVPIPAQARMVAAEEMWTRFYRTHSDIDPDGKVVAGTYTGGLSRNAFLTTCAQRSKGRVKTACAVDDTMERFGNSAVRKVSKLVGRMVASVSILSNSYSYVSYLFSCPLPPPAYGQVLALIVRFLSRTTPHHTRPKLRRLKATVMRRSRLLREGSGTSSRITVTTSPRHRRVLRTA